MRLHELILCAGMLIFPSLSHADWAQDVLLKTGTKGGIVVHLGCGDGSTTARFRPHDRFLVHGLDRDPANIHKARENLGSRRLYGPVSVSLLTGNRLPYAGNTVNLLVAEDLGVIRMEEILRVLVPDGAAYVKRGDRWQTIRKPRPPLLDEWTHFLHDATGNAVAADRTVGPPRRLQWAAGPLWSRHHDTVPSTSAMVSAAGRLFYISDEAPVCLDGSLPDKWLLVARDAFNGTLLWKRPIAEWGWRQWSAPWRGRFNIPPQLPKRLVAAGDRLFVTLGFNAPLTAIDAATGKVIRVYAGTERTDEILHRDGLLVLALNHHTQKPSQEKRPPIAKSVCAIDADSGKMLWKQGDYVGLSAKFNSGEPFGRLELALGGQQVFLVDHDSIVSLDAGTGRRRWRVPRPPIDEHLVMYGIRMSDQSVLVYHRGVVLLAQPEMKKKRSWHTLPGTLYAYRADDGRLLWKHPYGGWSHNWQPDVFVIDGVVWLHEHQDVAFPGHDPAGKDQIDYAVIGLDLNTGELKRRFSTQESFNVGHHHRCYRGKATERFLLASRRGVEFLDLKTEENHLHHWARGACLHGIVPCNGLLYLCPSPCQCYIATKLNGYYALAPNPPARHQQPPTRQENPLTKGPAFNTQHSSLVTHNSPAWPTFRHDPSRSGSTKAPVPTDLTPRWSVTLGGRLTPPVAAAGKVFLGVIDEHRVVALHAATGQTAWSFTAGGRVDTPPTIHHGLALFGCRDGWVYCLRHTDGKLVWRRRAAPGQRLVGAFGRLESTWPVHGSVLVKDNIAYLAAGRSSYLDQGIFLYALDPETGKVLKQRTIYSPDPKTGRQPPGDSRVIPGVLADILVSDGSSVYMRQQRVFGDDTSAHLFTTAGFRDDAWFNRTQWTIGGAAGAELLVFDDRTSYGISAYGGSNRPHTYHPGKDGYRLFAAEWKPKSSDRKKRFQPVWTTRVPLRITAMALAGRTLLAAGPPHVVDPEDPLAAFEGRKGAELWLISAEDGRQVTKHQLRNPPVFDGLIAAAGRVYLSTKGGRVVCLAGK